MEGSSNRQAALRARQERSVGMSHTLSAMEFALAREAAAVGEVFAQAGLPFDARTFVGLRLVEASVAESVEPGDVLRVLDRRGAIERSASIADDLLRAGD
jgi:hypothetical protein